MNGTRKILAAAVVGILAAVFAPAQDDSAPYANDSGGYTAPAPAPNAAEPGARSAYSYLRDSSGDVTVNSTLNGSVQARRNLPISAGDELKTDEPGRAEVALADGNVLHVGGGTSVRFASLANQQGTNDEISALELSEGSVILSVLGGDDGQAPRIDTEDATVYGTEGARVRVNSDVRRGTSVVVRAGSVEVKTRAGSYTVRAGNYLLVQGDQEPEIARGSFSRDRFDLWAADRLPQQGAPRSTSAEYVGEDYAGDVSSLDGYGNWDYNQDYDGYVWRPNVAQGWSPYSDGSWYYTPAGLTWWSWDPWGWYPFHYGSWFWNAGWCWYPGYVYSPAWVYWGFSGSWFGWCPVGYYGGHGHGGHGGWDGGHGGHGGHGWNGGHGGQGGDGGQGGHGGQGGGMGPGGGAGGNTRQQVVTAINGRYPTRNIDMRGWNFTNSSNVGQLNGRLAVTPGNRLSGRLGDQIAVSSRPIVVDRTGTTGGVRAALQDQIRQAPQTIERTASRDSQALAPVLAGQQNLSRETLDAIGRHTAVVDRGRVSGPGAADVAPRGATTVVDATRGGPRIATDRNGRTVITDRSPSTVDRGASRPDRPSTGPRAGDARPASPQGRDVAPRSQDGWRGTPDSRGRSVTRPGANNGGSFADREISRPDVRRPDVRRGEAAPSDSWRGRAPSTTSRGNTMPESRRGTSQPYARTEDSWRRSGPVPPAQRVIEGAVPNRRAPQGSDGMAPRGRSRDYGSPYGGGEPRWDTRREYVPRDSAPRTIDRGPRPGPPSSYQSPRSYAPPSREMPRSIDRGPAPRSAPSYSAPRSAPSYSAPRSAPAPSAPHSGRSRGR